MGELRLEVKAVGSLAGRAYPVTGGIPFPNGELSSSHGVRLYDASGREAAVQTDVLATWDPAGRQVKWLLVDFQAHLESSHTTWTLIYGPQVSPAPKTPAVNPEASPWPPDRIIESLYMSDQTDKLYRAGHEKEERSIETETAGPLRTVVRVQTWHADEAGNRLCRVILRLHYYAGLEQVRVFHSFVMDPDPDQVKLRSVGMKFPVSVRGSSKILVSGEQAEGEVLEANGPVMIFQDDEDHFWVSGGAAAAGRRNGTWVCLPKSEGSIGFFLRNGWEEFPKRLAFDGRDVDVQLWPSDGCPLFDLGRISDSILTPADEEQLRTGLAQNPTADVNMYTFLSKGYTDWTYGTALSLIRRARELETELFPDRAYYYARGASSGQGSMKTHELVLASLPSSVSYEEIGQLAQFVRHPPVLVASPEWNCDTCTFGTQVPYGVAPFPEVDYAMTYAEFFDHQEALDRFHLYGDRNWGDYFNGTASQGPLVKVYEDDPNFRIADRVGWMNLESHDSAVGPWIQFLRTGDPRLFYLAEAQTEHIATVDHRHIFPAPESHEVVIFYHGLRHYDTGLAPSHTLTNGILLGYYLTGDRGLREIGVAAADHWLSEQKKAGAGWYAGTSPSRQNIAPLTCVLNAHTLTWDEKYTASIDRFLDVWASVYDVTDPKHYLGGTLPYPGAEFLRQVKHEALEKVFDRIMEDVRTRMPVDGQGVYCMPGMAYMFEKTGDPTYAAYCQFVFEWHRSCLEQDGCSEWVHHNAFDVPAFSYGFVSGYAASGLALIAQARSQGVDLEAAIQTLREDRARAQGQDPRTTDGLYYSVRLYTEKPFDWYRPGSPTASRE